MTLKELMEVYTGNACLSIGGYCEEARYDYYTMPDEVEEDFKGNNPNHYIPRCLARESWYETVKNQEISRITVIGGGVYQTEMCIELKDN